MGETLDSGHEAQLLESMGSNLIEPIGGAFDLDMDFAAEAEEPGAQGNNAQLVARRIAGAICSITMAAFGLWLLFNIALAVTRSLGS